MRLTASKLDLAMQCLHWTTLDLPPDVSGPAAVFGTGFHELVVDGEHRQPLGEEEDAELRAMFAAWQSSGQKLLPPNARHEVAYAIGPNGAPRLLGENIGRRYRQHGARPDDVCLTVDVVGDWVVDFKTGRKYVAAFAAWQLRCAAIATGKRRVEFHYVDRKGRTTVDRADYTVNELRRYRAQLTERARDLREGRTAAMVGPHCTEMWCPGRMVCPALGAPKQIQERKENMSKMALNNVQRGKQDTPLCVCLYGPEGIGKSTFGAGAPKPIFLVEKDGTAHLDVERFPVPDTYEEAGQALDVLLNEKHDYQTFVLDTADWLEALIHRHVCKSKGKASIEDIGYGKGREYALDEWRTLLDKLDRIRDKGMNMIILAHSQVKKFQNPVGDDYERFQMKLNGKVAALLKEWSNAVLFANFLVYTDKDDKGRVRGFGDGSRIVYTEHRPAWDAKNRYGLPFEFPLNWDEFERGARAGEPVAYDAVSAELAGLIEKVDATTREKAQAAIGRAGKDLRKLAQLADWLRGKVSEAA